MICGPPIYNHEGYVPVTVPGFTGFVEVAVHLDMRAEQHTADVREVRGFTDEWDFVLYDGDEAPDGIARRAQELAIAEALVEYEHEAEEERFFYDRHQGAA